GQPLGHIHVFAATVIPLAGISLGVLVRQHGALRHHDGGASVVLAGDHLQALLLPPPLALNRLPDLGIGLLKAVHRHLLSNLTRQKWGGPSIVVCVSPRWLACQTCPDSTSRQVSQPSP